METLGYFFSGNGYLSLFLFLLTILFIAACAETIVAWIWEKFGDRISGMFRQTRP